MIIHQSDISAWARCPQAFHLQRSGRPQVQTSALSYGTVMHFALEVFERQWRTGASDWASALDEAVETFRHYWHPMNIASVAKPVERWLPRQTYAGMLRSGAEALRWYAEWAKDEDEQLLATEYGFQVPIEGTWDEEADEPHVLAGTVDRLAVKYVKGRSVVQTGDFKTGKDYLHLRENVQFTAYSYATTRREFWAGWRGEDGFAERGDELYATCRPMARHNLWISLKSHKVMDAGWRGPRDYTRFAIAVEQIVASVRAGIYPLSVSGENCAYCAFRESCAGVGVPDAAHGAPN